MANKVLSILLSAKDATASTFDRVKGGVKSMASDTQKATSGMKAAHEAVARAMRGDLVGAAQSASSAFKSLWSVILSNPLLAVAAAIAGAAVAAYKMVQAHKAAEEAARKHAQAIQDLKNELDALGGKDPTSIRKEMAKGMSRQELEARKREAIARKNELEALAMEAGKLAEENKSRGWATGKRNQEELDANAAGAKSAYKEMVDAVGVYEKAIEDVDKVQEAANKANLERIASELKAKQEQIDKEKELMDAELERLKTIQTAEGDMNAEKKQFQRERELAGAKTEAERREIKKGHIRQDLGELNSLTSAEAEMKRNRLRQEGWRLDQEAAKEAEKAASDAARDREKGLKTAKEELEVEKEIAAVKAKPKTLKERSEERMADLQAGRKIRRPENFGARGQMLAASQERMQSLNEGRLAMSKEARAALRGAAATASGFQSTKERKAEEAKKSAQENAIGANVQTIADILKDSLKPA